MRGSSNAPKIVHSNKNLLDNWDFTNPVNQRGIAVNTDRNDTGYFIDRWVNWTGSSGFKITSEGLQLYANSDIFQIMDKNLLGETVTFSICTADGIYNATFTGPSSVPSENIVKTQVINNIEFIFTILSNGNFQAALKPKKSVLVLAAKLELGEVSTLKNDALGVSYAEELLKCQRYFVNVGKFRVAGDLKATNGFAVHPIWFPCEMREKPAIYKSETLAPENVSAEVFDVQSKNSATLYIKNNAAYDVYYDCGILYAMFSAEL